MLKNHRTIRNIYRSLAGLIGLCCVAWLILALESAGNDPISHSQKQSSHQKLTVSLNDDRPSIEHDLDQGEGSFDPVDENTKSINNSYSSQCDVQCSSALSILDDDSEFDDKTFDKMRVYTEDIAAYLKSNASRRQHYLEMALTTADGDKRSFLIDVFKHLPYQQKIEIGASFIGSESWSVRADGVTLIADEKSSSLDVANRLMKIFSHEENSYIKGSILTTLKESSTLQGDAEILHQLDSAIYNERDPSVRVAAFKAKMQLSEQPYHILPDALQALRTSEPDLQFASLVAIDQILKNEKKYIESGVYIDKDSIKNEFQIIRNLAAYGDDKKRFDRLIREANTIYLRYFDS